MRRFAVVGLAGAVLATVSVSYAAEEIVVASSATESAGDAGYAPSSTRSMAIELFAKEAMGGPAVATAPAEVPLVATKTEAVAVQPEEPQLELAAVAMVVPTPRPDFEATKSVTQDISPSAPVAQRADPVERKIVKVSDKVDKKRITSLPLPVYIGAFR